MYARVQLAASLLKVLQKRGGDSARTLMPSAMKAHGWDGGGDGEVDGGADGKAEGGGDGEADGGRRDGADVVGMSG